ncbi:PDZ domain-containing protein [Caldimonas brevitalea]|uniref:PDZ domain-containing protein n=1 Tax=Caldimonas brevitalea TaxID=413882 RepID=A0A0G3BWX6_9BURK|nr:PDZ domain-containing protein [Caldimonas brevitalea]AKJ31866.1 hypothetical protein AAW51_5175 [Caldimonas brevitalea]
MAILFLRPTRKYRRRRLQVAAAALTAAAAWQVASLLLPEPERLPSASATPLRTRVTPRPPEPSPPRQIEPLAPSLHRREATAPLLPAARAVDVTEAPWRQTNPLVEPEMLTVRRFLAAQEFLREVPLQPSGPGAYTVRSVPPNSVYARLGLRPGDVIHSLDTSHDTNVGDGSLDDVMQQTTMEMQVQRAGRAVTLRLRLDVEDGVGHGH